MGELTLNVLGWNDWFQRQAADFCEGARFAARVAAVDRNQLLLAGEAGFFHAKLSGKYMHESESAAERPCVGDWVCAS